MKPASIYGGAEAARAFPAGLSLFQAERLVDFGQMAAASLAGMVFFHVCGLCPSRSGWPQG